MDANRPVPFRLTPNIVEFLTSNGINGPLTASMIASARCLVHPSFKVPTILRAILRDEMIAGHKKVGYSLYDYFFHFYFINIYRNFKNKAFERK